MIGNTIGGLRGMRSALEDFKRQSDQIKRNIQLRRARLEKGVEIGLKRAGLRLQRESQKMVPVEYGVLKASAFTRATGAGFNTRVNVGYTALYALWVHESIGMVLKGLPRRSGKGKYWDPQGRAQAKFLEEPSRRPALIKEMIQIVKDSAKIT